MNVVLTHPIHGAKIAINELEMKQDEKNGWVRYNPDTLVEVELKSVVEESKRTRKVIKQPVEQTNEVPQFLASVSDESEGS